MSPSIGIKCGLRAAIGFALGLGLLLGQAHAAPFQYDFSGTITSERFNNHTVTPSPGIAIGNPISGTLYFDDSNPEASNLGSYSLSLALDGPLGDDAWNALAPFQVDAFEAFDNSNNLSAWYAQPVDYVFMGFYQLSEFTATTARVNVFALLLVDTTASLFDGDGTPLAALALGNFDDVVFSLVSGELDFLSGLTEDDYIFNGEMSNITAVPVPAAGPLFAAALLMVGALRRRRSP